MKISNRWRMAAEYSPYKRVKFEVLSNKVKIFFTLLRSLSDIEFSSIAFSLSYLAR